MLKQNKKSMKIKTRILRGMNKFEIFVLENDKKYLKITKKRLEKNWKRIRKLIGVFLFMSQFAGRYCTVYKKKVNPDFIYLDGPDIFM